MDKKSFEHTILKFNRDLQINPEAFDLFHRMFIWANEMGIEGKKVTGLKYIPTEEIMMGPTISGKFTCTVFEADEKKNG